MDYPALKRQSRIEKENENDWKNVFQFWRTLGATSASPRAWISRSISAGSGDVLLFSGQVPLLMHGAEKRYMPYGNDRQLVFTLGHRSGVWLV
jgi:hypothetical protein